MKIYTEKQQSFSTHVHLVMSKKLINRIGIQGGILQQFRHILYYTITYHTYMAYYVMIHYNMVYCKFLDNYIVTYYTIQEVL